MANGKQIRLLFIGNSSTINYNGLPLAAGTATIYAAGTTTLLTVYSDAAKTTSITNPVTLDNQGYLDCFVDNQTVDMVIKDADGNTGYTLNGFNYSMGNADLTVVPVTASTYAANTTSVLILADATSNAITINLRTAAGISGQRIVVQKTDSSANAVILDGDGSETISGSATKTLSSQYTVADLCSDGTNWVILNPFFSYLSSGTLKHEHGGIEADISAVATGDILAGTSSGTMGLVAASGKSAGDVLTLQAGGTVDYETPMKIHRGTLQWTTSNTGTQSITGVGFQPTHGLFFSSYGSVYGVGMVGDSLETAQHNFNGGTQHAWAHADNYIHQYYATGSNVARVQHTSWDSDGFTLTWSKSGNPTATIKITYLLFG